MLAPSPFLSPDGTPFRRTEFSIAACEHSLQPFTPPLSADTVHDLQ